MPSDADRRVLFTALHDRLGERPASILMELLPVSSSELARRTDLVAIRAEMAELRAELKGEMAELRGEMVRLRADLEGQMVALRADLEGQMAELRADLEGQMAVLQNQMTELRAEVKGELTEMRAELRGGMTLLTARIDSQVPKFLLASVPATLGFGGLVLAAAKLA